MKGSKPRKQPTLQQMYKEIQKLSPRLAQNRNDENASLEQPSPLQAVNSITLGMIDISISKIIDEANINAKLERRS